MLVVVDRGDPRIILGRPIAEPARIEFGHADLGRAVHHPLRQILADARALADADGHSRRQPIAGCAGCGPREKVAVRRVGDRARNHRLDARLAKQRQPLGGFLQPWCQPVEFRRQQFALEVPGNAIVKHRMRAFGLVGANQDAVGLLAQITVRIRIAHDRQLALEVDKLLQRLGDDIVVQHVGDGHIVPGPAADDAGIGTSAIHDVLAHNAAVRRLHLPFTGTLVRDVRHPAAPHDGHAQFARARRHGVGDIGGGNMAVGDGKEPGLDAEGCQIGMVLANFVRANNVGLIPNQFAHGVNVAEPIHLLVRECQPDAAAAVPAYGLPRQAVQFRIEFSAILMDFRQRERAVELGALARRVPGRARCEFALFQQHHVTPAFQRQVIGQPDADNAAANYDHTGVCGKGGHERLLKS